VNVGNVVASNGIVCRCANCWVNVRAPVWTVTAWLPVFVTRIELDFVAPGAPSRVTWSVESTMFAPVPSAASTAARASSSPAPCSSAGRPRSRAVPVMICLISAGDGELPWWLPRYAWMTSAAVAAVSGADSLVPPKDSRSVGSGGERKFMHSA
jgi:hypothetical protein